MKKKYINLCLSIVTLGFVNAQPVINATDFNPSTGESFTNNMSSYQNPGASGTNVTWDFSSLVGTSTSVVSYISPNASFPQTNHNQSTGGTANQYINMTNDGWYTYGVLGNGVTITYQNPMQFISLPMTMGASHSDDFAATFVSSGYNFTRGGVTTSEVDAYGTLITPEGTFTDVLRIHYTQDYADTNDILGVYSYSVDIYSWYKAGYHNELASFSILNSDFGSSSFGTFMETTGLGLSEEEQGLITVFPNPVKDYFTIKVNDVIDSEIFMSDLNGQKVGISVQKDNKQFHVSTESLTSGVYLLNFKNSLGEMFVRKIIVE